MALAQQAQGRETVEARQTEVGQDGMRAEVVQRREEGVPVLDPELLELQAGASQHPRVQLRVGGVVFQQQDSQQVAHQAERISGGTRLTSTQYMPRSATVRANSSKETGLATKLLTPSS